MKAGANPPKGSSASRQHADGLALVQAQRAHSDSARSDLDVNVELGEPEGISRERSYSGAALRASSLMRCSSEHY
jgi:hypothetical protein